MNLNLLEKEKIYHKTYCYIYCHFTSVLTNVKWQRVQLCQNIMGETQVYVAGNFIAKIHTTTLLDFKSS